MNAHPLGRSLSTAGSLDRVYSDASFEGGELRIGWVLFSNRTPRSWAGTCLVPQAAIEEWKQRKQLIFIGETLAVLLLPLLAEHLFTQADVLWFVDNAAAVVASVHAGSQEDDVHEVALSAAQHRVSTACRAWFEWIDSASNPADGLSRLGLSDPWSLDQGWDSEEYQFPPSAYRNYLASRIHQ